MSHPDKIKNTNEIGGDAPKSVKARPVFTLSDVNGFKEAIAKVEYVEKNDAMSLTDIVKEMFETIEEQCEKRADIIVYRSIHAMLLKDFDSFNIEFGAFRQAIYNERARRKNVAINWLEENKSLWEKLKNEEIIASDDPNFQFGIKSSAVESVLNAARDTTTTTTTINSRA